MKNKLKYTLSLLNKQKLLLFFLTISTIIISGGYLYYRYEKKTICQAQYNNLKIIADFKINQIVQWRNERLGDANIFAEDAIFRKSLLNWLLSKDKDIEKDILQRFSSMCHQYNYNNIFVVSTEGNILLELDTNSKHIHKLTIDFCKKAVQSKKTLISDLYFFPSENAIHFDIIVPIMDDKNIPLAIIVMSINPYDYLYPLIQTWPTHSKSAETLIVRKEGDSILYMNELRHISNTVLKLRFPLTSKEVSSVEAVLGRVGIFEGRDYRGVEVISYLKPVPGTPWFMISKIDRSEIYTELYYKAVIIIIDVILLLLLGIGIAWLFNNRQKNIFRELLEISTTLQKSQEEFRAILYSIGDAVITTDVKGYIRNMNVVAEKLTGWNEPDAVGRLIGEVFQVINEESRNIFESPVQRVLKEGLLVGIANHTLLISKEGKEIPIAYSGAPIHSNKGVITGAVLVFRDQTSEREAEKSLRESEEKLKEAQSMAHLGFWQWVIKTGEVEWSDEVYKIFCLNPNEFSPHIDSIIALSPWPEDNQRDKELIARAIETHNGGSYEQKFLRPDKSIGYYYSTFQGKYDEKGNLISIVGTVLDITESKRAEEALLKERALLKTLIDNLPVGVFVKDKEYKKIIVNQVHTKEVMGHLKYLKINVESDILGKTDFEIFPKHLAEKFFDEDRKVMQGESIINSEGFGFSEDGNQLYLLTSKIPLRDNNGEIIGMVGVTTDVTEFKKSEEKLAMEQYFMRTLMDNLPENIYFKDRESRFLRISYALSKFFGLSDPAMAVGKTDFDFFSEEHARQAYNDEQAIIRTGEPLRKEEKETLRDRPDVWVSTIKMPMRDKEGNIIGTFGISVDITEQKESELILLQKNIEIATQNEEFQHLNEELLKLNNELQLSKEKAEESDRLKTAFLHNMSHEIRTPMNGILGFAELLKTPDLSDFKQHQFIDIIEQSGQRMLNMINDIINISKIETGEIELEIKETNVNQILHNLHNFFKPQAEAKGLNLIYITELSDELCKIATDETKLTQIISNLIKNAIKFTQTGFIEFGYTKKEKMMEFFVKDTGIGISPEKQNIIFERFRQVDMEVSRKYEGAGLGLSISKAFVEKLGGKIWVESELSKGAVFKFNIPYSSNKVEIAEAKINSQLQNINILVVEDESYCMQLLEEMLESEHIKLFFANNGQEALELVKNKPEIQIVLMDLKMPIMDGFAATKLIKSLKPHLPIIAQSAYAFADEKDKAIKAGCDEYISKPIKPNLLLSMIHKLLLRQ